MLRFNNRLRLKFNEPSALIVVDPQKGFTKYGWHSNVKVPNADLIVKPINFLLKFPWNRIDATQDWHPRNHCSFPKYGVHCLKNSYESGWMYHLQHKQFMTVWRKGYLENKEALSVVEQHPGIIALYKAELIRNVVVCGLAQNICVSATARDFNDNGFNTFIIEEASAGIDLADNKISDTKHKDIKKGIVYLPLVNDIIQ